MSNIALLLLCLVAGALLRRAGQLPAGTPKAINRFLIWLSLPALVLLKVTPLVGTVTLSRELLLPITLAWFLFAVAFLLGRLLGARLGWSLQTTGAMILAVGLGNTLFVGYPLIEWRLGPEALPIAVLVDQLGSFLVLSTLAVVVAATFGGAKVGWRQLARRLAKFPPFLWLLVAIGWGLSGTFSRATGLVAVLERLAACLVPLAVFSVGASLEINVTVVQRRWRQVTFGLLCKLVLLPALCVLVYGQLLGLRGLPYQVTILQSAMAPMATSAVLVTEFHLDEELASLLLGLGIPLSIATVYLWSLLL